MQKAILITGCSSGIGRSLAKLLLDSGYYVVVTGRKTKTLDSFKKEPNCLIVSLDVASLKSINAAFAKISIKKLFVNVLVNNAGYGIYGPIEELQTSKIRQQFETNVFGLIHVTKKVIPNMRKFGEGRIVNISSIVGKVAFPYLGIYCASKFALEAISGSLSGELKQWGIKVISINPGPIKTNFAFRSRGTGVAVLSKSSPYISQYSKVIQKVGQGVNEDEHSGMSSEDAAKIIFTACTVESPRSRYNITGFAKLLTFLQKILPENLFNYLIYKGMGL